MKDDYRYLWDRSSDVWALLHVNNDRLNEEPVYIIVNIVEKTALLISDDFLAVEVKNTMLDNGAKIVTVGNGF